jgi:hypothetical protein
VRIADMLDSNDTLERLHPKNISFEYHQVLTFWLRPCFHDFPQFVLGNSGIVAQRKKETITIFLPFLSFPERIK